MTVDSDFSAETALADAAGQLAATVRWLATQGWAPATSGNFSLRTAADQCAITTSGRDKEKLEAAHVMAVRLDGHPASPGRPSAETLLHLRLYRRFPAAGAVLHTHSVASMALSRAIGAGGHLDLAGWELIKAFPGITSHEASFPVPILANSQDMPALADLVDEALDETPAARAYLIAGHGTYTWGLDLETARLQVQALETLFAAEIQLRLLRGTP